MRTTYIDLCKRAATDQIVHAKVYKFVNLRLHTYLEFTQRIKMIEYADQPYDEMKVTAKTLHVSLASFRFAAYLKNFLLAK